MRQWIGSALVQMACRPFSAKPLSKTMLGYSLSIGHFQTNCSEILIKIQKFSFMKMHATIVSAKWWPFCPGGNELIRYNPSALSDAVLRRVICPESLRWQMACNFLAVFNSLWPSDTISWCCGYGSTRDHVMACYMFGALPSHYLNQCWLVNGTLLN